MINRLIDLMKENKYFRYLIYMLMFPFAAAFGDFWADKLFYQVIVLLIQLFAVYLFVLYTVRKDEE